MPRKREERKPRRMKKVILVVCEGETEAAYVDFLKQYYRSPIKIVPKVSGHDVNKRKLDEFKKKLIDEINSLNIEGMPKVEKNYLI